MQPPKVEDDAKDHKGAGKAPAQQEEPKEPKITSEKLEADKMEEILSKQDKDLYWFKDNHKLHFWNFSFGILGFTYSSSPLLSDRGDGCTCSKSTLLPHLPLYSF